MSSILEALPKDPKEWLLYTALASAIGGLVFKSIHSVEQGEKGVLTRNGKPIRELGTGPKWAVPPVWHIKKANVKDRTSQLKDALFQNEDQFWKADVSVIWAVRDDKGNPTKSLFEIEHGELDDTVKEICADGLDMAFRMHKEEPADKLEDIKKSAIELSEEDLLRYGVAVKRFNIYNPTPRESEIVKQGSVSIGQAILSELMSQQNTEAGGQPFYGTAS